MSVRESAVLWCFLRGLSRTRTRTMAMVARPALRRRASRAGLAASPPSSPAFPLPGLKTSGLPAHTDSLNLPGSSI